MIKTQKLTKQYHAGATSLSAIHDIDLEIAAGEFIAITGPSGAGKSTLLHLLGCLDTPTSGEYFLNGRNVGHLTLAELALIRNQNIGYVFQDSMLLSHLNAMENVSLPLIYAGIDELKALESAKHLLTDLGLADRLSFYPEQLSGGQQQRIAIARALAMEPKLILADEPTGNLDTENAQLIMNILIKLNRNNGVTIILVTHEPSLAKQAHKIITIIDGKIHK